VHNPQRRGKAVVEDHWKVSNAILKAGVFTYASMGQNYMKKKEQINEET